MRRLLALALLVCAPFYAQSADVSITPFGDEIRFYGGTRPFDDTEIGMTFSSGRVLTITANGTFVVSGAQTYDANITLDDGAGASPSLVFTDGSDETATFTKADGLWLQLTTLAADGLNMLTGNIKLGNGTPDVSQDGEDFYCEGTSEFDGAMRVDGALTLNSTTTSAGVITLDDGTGASPSLVFTDATDETATWSKVDAGALTLTTDATDGLGVLVGNLTVGNGSPTNTPDGEDVYVEGFFEVDGIAYLDGATNAVGTVTLDDGAGASPSFVFQDGTDETATLGKVDAGFLNFTTDATDGLGIVTGNLRVGNGTADNTPDGEDFYCEGNVEIDGTSLIDGIMTHTANVDLDDGTGASPSLIWTDATN